MSGPSKRGNASGVSDRQQTRPVYHEFWSSRTLTRRAQKKAADGLLNPAGRSETDWLNESGQPACRWAPPADPSISGAFFLLLFLRRFFLRWRFGGFLCLCHILPLVGCGIEETKCQGRHHLAWPDRSAASHTSFRCRATLHLAERSVDDNRVVRPDAGHLPVGGKTRTHLSFRRWRARRATVAWQARNLRRAPSTCSCARLMLPFNSPTQLL